MREFYTQVEDGDLVKIEVELEAQQMIDEVEFYPWLYTVFIKLKHPMPDGLADEDEEDFLSECKDRLAIKLEEKEKAVYVGSKTTAGWYELYFYLQDPKGIENKTKDILNAFDYKFESNAVKDKKWNLYETSLYPNLLQSHHIQSRQIIDELVEEGDDVAKEREVEHYILFQTASLREKFVASLEEHSLTCKDEFERDAEEYVYGIIVPIMQAVDAETMNKTTDMFMELCSKDHGYYEGWSTSMADEQN